MTDYREILRLHNQGISQRTIAASCACSRNTVAKILNRAQELVVSWPLKAGIPCISFDRFTPAKNKSAILYPNIFKVRRNSFH